MIEIFIKNFQNQSIKDLFQKFNWCMMKQKRFLMNGKKK